MATVSKPSFDMFLMWVAVSLTTGFILMAVQSASSNLEVESYLDDEERLKE